MKKTAAKNKLQKFLSVALIPLLVFTMLPAFALTTVQDSTAAGKSGDNQTADYMEDAENYMDADLYENFSFDIDDPNDMPVPGDFNTDMSTDPMANYTPSTLSELYIGQMNRKSPYTGDFVVADNMTQLNESNMNLDTMAEKSVGGSKTEFPNSGKTSKSDLDKMRYQAQNACAIRYDKNSSIEGILDYTLYTGTEGSDIERGERGSVGKINLYQVDSNAKSTEKYKAIGSITRGLSDDDSDNPTWVENLETDSALAYMAMCAGDFDGDGAEEGAVYIPCDKDNPRPYISIVKYVDGSLKQIYSFTLSEMNKSAFGQRYHDWQLPIVSLTATDMAGRGRDDLVINACLPRKTSNGYEDFSQDSMLGIYTWDSSGSTMQKEYVISLENNGSRMRYASAVETDLNRNGVKELLIGGHKNYRYGGTYDSVGEMDRSHNLFQMITWNDENKTWQYVWGASKEVSAIEEIYTDKEVVEPAALCAGNFLPEESQQQIFMEGMIFRCTNVKAEEEGLTEADLFKDASFSAPLFTMELDGQRNLFISKAVSGTFTLDQAAKDQLVVTSGYIDPMVNYVISIDASWIWAPNTAGFKQQRTNYIKSRNERKDGTFLTLCDINADEDTVYFELKNKEYGWSKPQARIVIPTPPFWDDLQYGENPYAPGAVHFKIGNGSGGSSGYTIDAGGGINFGITEATGACLLQEKLGIGVAADLSAALNGCYSKFSSYNQSSSSDWDKGAGVDQVLCTANAVVIYTYDVWIPEYTLTSELRELYKEEFGEYPKDEDGDEYPVGAVLGGEFQEMAVTNVYDPQYASLTIEQYNDAVEASLKADPALELKKIDMEKVMGSGYTPGDPASYPKDAASLVNTNIDFIPKTASDSYETIEEGNGAYTMAFDSSKSFEETEGWHVDLNISLEAQLSYKVGFLCFNEGQARAGVAFNSNTGKSYMSSTITEKSVTSTIAELPSGAEAYSYDVNMAIWKTNLGESDTADTPYVAGCLVKNADAAPPDLPSNARAYSATKDTITLSWDDTDKRESNYYRVYRYQDTGHWMPVKNETSGKEYTSDNFFTVGGLQAGTEYTFAIRAFTYETDAETDALAGRHCSVYSAPFAGATNTDPAPVINAVSVEPDPAVVGEQVTMTADAEPTSPERTLTYRWEKYYRDTIPGQSGWRTVQDSKKNTYDLTNCTMEDAGQYRVLV